jgi:hypothetical protein
VGATLLYGVESRAEKNAERPTLNVEVSHCGAMASVSVSQSPMGGVPLPGKRLTIPKWTVTRHGMPFRYAMGVRL